MVARWKTIGSGRRPLTCPNRGREWQRERETDYPDGTELQRVRLVTGWQDIAGEFSELRHWVGRRHYPRVGRRTGTVCAVAFRRSRAQVLSGWPLGRVSVE